MKPLIGRRRFLTAVAAVPALGLLAACGSDSPGDSLQSSDSPDGASDTTTAPTTESPAAPQEAVPPTEPTAEPMTDAASADPILSYTTPGGFTTSQVAFQDPPIVLLASDGTLIGPGVTTAVFPGPLLPVHQVQTVTPVGVEALIVVAGEAGLLADVDYSTDSDLLIADAATSVLTITADGTTYTHEAYALGIGGGPGSDQTESTPQRQALLDFLTALQTDPASIFGADNLGASSVYEPVAYQFTAMSMTGADIAAEATIVEWPAETGIDLASATECVEVDRAVVGGLFEEATQLTFFEQDGENYQVTPRPAYPGRSC